MLSNGWLSFPFCVHLVCMTLIAVSSSAIEAIGFDGYTLSVKFYTSDTVYEHHGCPESLFEDFMNAPSMGEFYNQYIRNQFQ